MARVYLGLGSNVEPEPNLRAAVAALRELYGSLEVSPTYRSAAVGFEGDDFLNLVVGLDTDETPEQILGHIKELHEAAGRDRSDHGFVARTLDIDLLLVGDLVRREAPIKVPRKDVLEYAFVLRPLAEIAGSVIHPETGRTFAEHWSEFDQAGHPMSLVHVEY